MWINRKYVKLLESHELKYQIKIKSQKKENDLMDSMTKKIKL